MIRPCGPDEIDTILTIINDAATVYRGVIPADRWHDPYMDPTYLLNEIQKGVSFWGYEDEEGLEGIMGIQDVMGVTLIRHAYVRTSKRKQGIGGKLLGHLKTLTHKPLLIGTWKVAGWAIDFYIKHGFRLVDEEEKNRLLRKYWNIPERQVETSCVLADQRYFFNTASNIRV